MATKPNTLTLWPFTEKCPACYGGVWGATEAFNRRSGRTSDSVLESPRGNPGNAAFIWDTAQRAGDQENAMSFGSHSHLGIWLIMSAWKQCKVKMDNIKTQPKKAGIKAPPLPNNHSRLYFKKYIWPSRKRNLSSFQYFPPQFFLVSSFYWTTNHYDFSKSHSIPPPHSKWNLRYLSCPSILFSQKHFKP